MGLREKIRTIEEEMKRTQIHEHTEHHVGLLKAKLAKLKAEQEEKPGREPTLQKKAARNSSSHALHPAAKS